MPAIEKAGLMVTDIEILRLHYAETLKHWRERFLANRDAAKAIYDERFCRMWEFYLAGSEAAFRWQDMVVFQIQMAKQQRHAADDPRLHGQVRKGAGHARDRAGTSRAAAAQPARATAKPATRTAPAGAGKTPAKASVRGKRKPAKS